MSNAEDISTKKRPFRYLVAPPKLKTLASQQMALIACQHVAHNDIDDDDDHWGDFSEPVSYKEYKYIPCDMLLPALVDKVRFKLCDPVAFSIENWCDYHIENVFFDCNIHIAMVNCIDEFILSPDGTISYLATARNVLLSAKFDVVEKFRMACIHCLADDVRSIWPLVSLNPRIVNCDSNSNPLVCYWITVMKGESQRLPVGEDDSDSLEGRLKVFDRMQWPAVQYFWNVLSHEEQTALALRMMKRDTPLGHSKFIERILQQLNERHINEIFEEVDVFEILYRSFVGDVWNHKKLILRIWNHTVSFVPVNKFATIITKFIEDGFVGGEDRYQYVGPLLLQMWTDAPAHLKRYVLNNSHSLESIFESLHSQSYEYCDLRAYRMQGWDYDMRFFIAVLNDLSFQTRNKLWCKYWTKLIVGTTPKCLEEIMKLCFNNEDEIVLFKERHMLDPEKIEKFCALLIMNNHISKLEEYFKFCSSNVHFVAIVKRQILGGADIEDAFLAYMSNEKFYEFDKFIDSAYFVDEDARNYKRNLLLPSKRLQDTYAGLDKARLGVSWI